MKPINGKLIIFSIILAIVSTGLYLIWSKLTYRNGFPLDDAWIHQTYARNIATLGEWSFIPGNPSSGSTAPLWTLLLAVGHIFNIAPSLWSNFLGIICLVALAAFGSTITNNFHPKNRIVILTTIILLLFEYHLVWAALSGMETILYSLFICLVIFNLRFIVKSPILGGLLLGLGMWIRPDGITLLGPAIFFAFVTRVSLNDFIIKTAKLFAGLCLLALPYLLFNWLTAGSIWPATFYAKQAEYVSLTDFPLFQRLVSLLVLPLIGVGILLLPGAVFNLSEAIHKHKWETISSYLWWVGYILIYALRLPVTYQHGRYLIPLMPVYFVWGISGTVFILDRIRAPSYRWIVGRAWYLSTFAVLFAFWVLGGRAYAMDVAIIESEMVDTAEWISDNTPEDALIAAHDIGALGYFGQRDIFDMAGLVTPETIPFFSDEAGLLRLIQQAGSSYLFTFPDWYERLEECGVVVFTTHAPFSPASGGTNMTVYELIPGCKLE